MTTGTHTRAHSPTYAHTQHNRYAQMTQSRWLSSDRRFLQLHLQHFLNDCFCSAHTACSCHGYALCRLIIAWVKETSFFCLEPLSGSVCHRLKNLPFTFTKLKDLAALWLSDNQVSVYINATQTHSSSTFIPPSISVCFCSLRLWSHCRQKPTLKPNKRFWPTICFLSNRAMMRVWTCAYMCW